MKKIILSFGAIISIQAYVVAQCTPVFTANNDIVVDAASGTCAANVTYSNPVFTGCAAGTLVQTAGLPSGSSFPVGVTTNTFQVNNIIPKFFEDFSDNTAGWTLGTEWAIGSALASGCGGSPDPSVDHTPTADNGVAGVVLGGCYGTALHGFYYLTSPVINLSGTTGTVTLDFYRWLNSDYPNYVTNQIQVFNGSSWVTIWESTCCSFIDESTWNNYVYNITAYANANFQVRFGHAVGSGGVIQRGGWNLDDISIYESVSTGVTTSFDVMVSNTQPEFSTCPSNLTVPNTSGLACSEPVTYPDPVVSSGCSAVNTTMSTGLVSGSNFPVGTTTVTYQTSQITPSFTVLFNEDFSDNSAGWSLGTEWQIGAAAPSGCGGPSDPSIDHSSTADNGVAGVILGGCYTTAIHGYYYLTSPVIDLSTTSGTVTMEFWRWLNSDYPNYVTNQVQVFDGVSWVTLWQSTCCSFIDESTWNNYTYDITAYANANFQVRFGHTVGTGGAIQRGGWNLDDVIIYGNATLSSSCSFDVTVEPFAGAVSDGFCAGSTYAFGSQTITTAGTYVENFVGGGIGGCDSTVTLTLTENPIYNELASASICQGDTYLFGTQTLDSDGEYTEVFASMNGCDSTVTLSLTVNEVYDIVINQSICDGDSYLFAGTNYTTAGTYVDNSISMSGCDSITTLNLTVNMPYTGNETEQICAGTEYVFGTQTLTTTGDYTEVFQDINGCDSTVTLTLIVNDLPTITLVSTTDEIGGNDGAIDVTAASANTFTVDWSNGESTEDISGLEGGVYTVTVTDDVTGCSNSLEVTVDSQVGITENTTQLVTIYPNPNKGVFTVNAGNEKISEVIAIDNLGRIVNIYKDLDSSKPVIDMSGFEPGSYRLIIQINDSTVLKPVMIH